MTVARRRFVAVLLVCLSPHLAWCGETLYGEEPSSSEHEERFVSMFDGQSFSGWQFDGKYTLPAQPPANWSVADGVIKVAGGGGPHLGSQWDYIDFDMRFEWRAMRERYNSGFYIRSGRKVGANQINLAKGGEGRFFGGKMNGGAAVPELQKPAFEWNTWRVVVVGDKVSFYCNGQLAWEGTEFAAKRGHIGLQAEGAPLEFRNLRIKELGWDYLGTNTISTPCNSTARDYQDYVLRLEYRAAKDAVGQIALRGADASGAILSVGDLPDGSGGLMSAEGKPAKKLDNPIGQWNYLEVRASGEKAAVWLNGAVVNEALPLPSAQGGIDVLADDSQVEFRNARVLRMAE